MYQYQTIVDGKSSVAIKVSGTMAFDAKGKMYYGEEYNYTIDGNNLIIKKNGAKEKAVIVILNQTDLILDFNYSSSTERRFLKKTE